MTKFFVELFSIIIVCERELRQRRVERETFNRRVKERGDFEAGEHNWRKMKKEIDRENAQAKRRRSSLCVRCKGERAILSQQALENNRAGIDTAIHGSRKN